MQRMSDLPVHATCLEPLDSFASYMTSLFRTRGIVSLATALFIGVPQGALGETMPSASSAELVPVRVLFIGNSYTYYHQMPAAVAAMAQVSTGARLVQYDMVAESRATLQSHGESGRAQAAIRKQKWDFVVLQEQSLRPVRRFGKMLEYAKLLDEEIKRNGARTVLFATWARQGQAEMQDKLNAAYHRVAAALNAPVAPVGQVWRTAIEADGELHLYEKDASHPSVAGSYLIACVIHLTLQADLSHCPVIPVGGAVVDGAERVARIAQRSAQTSSEH